VNGREKRNNSKFISIKSHRFKKMANIPLHVVFVEAWIKKDGKFLLAKRSSKDDQAAGKWAVPGGKAEFNLGSGIIEETLAREVQEEVGLKIGNLQYLCSRSFIRSSGHSVIALSFIADYFSGQARALEDQEEVKWATLEEAKKILDEHWKNTLTSLEKSINTKI
jgi:ADP-ribose pyrophosphatase YjhB (NUDIX family)